MNINLVKQYEAGGRQEDQLRDRRERWERGTGRLKLPKHLVHVGHPAHVTTSHPHNLPLKC